MQAMELQPKENNTLKCDFGTLVDGSGQGIAPFVHLGGL